MYIRIKHVVLFVIAVRFFSLPHIHFFPIRSKFHFVMCFPFGYRWQQALLLLLLLPQQNDIEMRKINQVKSVILCVCVCGAPLIILVTLDDAHTIFTHKCVLSKGSQQKKNVGSTVYGWQYD